jgi:hypothetical protein
MSDRDRLTSPDDTASAVDKHGLNLALLWLLFSPRSSGIWSSMPRCRDTLRDEPRARCEFRTRPFGGQSLHRDAITFAGTPRLNCLPAFR